MGAVWTTSEHVRIDLGTMGDAVDRLGAALAEVDRRRLDGAD